MAEMGERERSGGKGERGKGGREGGKGKGGREGGGGALGARGRKLLCCDEHRQFHLSTEG